MRRFGVSLGAFCVTDITESRRDFGPAGLALRIALQVSLCSAEFNRRDPQALAAASFQFCVQAAD